MLDYAEIKALAVGDPRIKKRIETANELSRYLALQKRAEQSRTQLQAELGEIPGRIQNQRERIENCRKDIAWYETSTMPTEKKQRAILRETLHRLILENEMREDERAAFLYQGFQIILPANMVKEKPFVYVQGKGRYYVELGGTESGDLIRIDHFLESFPEYLDKQQNALTRLLERETAIKKLLKKNENYGDEIQRLKKELNALDNELGVQTDGK